MFGESDYPADEAEERQVKRAPDRTELAAIKELGALFAENRDKVFYVRQLQVHFEHKYFHWVTYRAIKELALAKIIVKDERALTTGNKIDLVWHRSFRYHRRSGDRIVKLVEEYANQTFGEALGHHGESMVLQGFARNRFLMEGQHTNSFNGRTWTKSGHNMDFIFSKDGKSYGIEVKNTLSYMPEKEFKTKIQLCRHILVRPVFVVRMLPKTWIEELWRVGGFALILKYQLYPRSHKALAERVKSELGFPIGTARALEEGTMARFTKWHERTRELS